MKITLIDSTTQEPYSNRAVLLQIKDTETGQIKNTLTLRSTQDGALTLDQKYEGAQICASVNGAQSAWVEAAEDATIEVKGTSAETTKNIQQGFSKEGATGAFAGKVAAQGSAQQGGFAEKALKETAGTRQGFVERGVKSGASEKEGGTLVGAKDTHKQFTSGASEDLFAKDKESTPTKTKQMPEKSS